MNENYFSKTIQNRGKEYFQQNRVFSLSGKNNKYSALVLGTEPYHVLMQLDAKGNIQKASCDCPYAQDGYRCKHEAALYYALEERILENSSQFFDVKKVYQKLKRTTYGDYALNNRFMSELNQYIKTMISLNEKGMFDITYFQKVIDDLMNLPYPSAYKRRIISKVLTTYKKLMNDKHEKNTVHWLKKCLSDDNGRLYKEYFLDVLETLSVKDQIDVLQKALLKRKDVELFEDYIKLVDKYHLDIMEYLKGMDSYDDCDIYHYQLIRALVERGQRKEAYDRFQQIKNKNIMTNQYYLMQIESLVIKGKEDVFYRYILKNCQYYRYDMVIECYQELKSFYGENWQRYNEDFLNHLKKKCNQENFYYILSVTDNIKFLVGQLMIEPDFRVFCNYKDKIKAFDEESCLFLYVECLLNYVPNIKSARDYDEMEYDIEEVFDIVDEQLIKQEIAQLFIEKYPKRKRLKEMFDRYLSLEGEKEDEIRY